MEQQNPIQENTIPKKVDRKLIIAYSAIGVVVLAVIALAIYNNTRPKAPIQQQIVAQNNTASTAPQTEKLDTVTFLVPEIAILC